MQQKLNRLGSELNMLNARKNELKKSLDSEKKILKTAEEEKSFAERQKIVAVAGTAFGGFGVALLGVVFPPSLFVTVPAITVAGVTSIAIASEKIEQCEAKISKIEGAIQEKKQEIRTTNNDITNTRSRITELKNKQQQQHFKLEKVKNSRKFMQRAVNYFKELQDIVKGGQNTTNQLLSFVAKINREERYRIVLSSDEDVTIVASSFAEAWKVVEDKIMSGDQEDFMKIIFEEVPDLR